MGSWTAYSYSFPPQWINNLFSVTELCGYLQCKDINVTVARIDKNQVEIQDGQHKPNNKSSGNVKPVTKSDKESCLRDFLPVKF